MKRILSLALALALAGFAAPGLAAQDSQHKEHHPVAPAMTSVPADSAMSKQHSTHMMQMDAQMKLMQEMHDKMMAAKTPEQHKALMAAHMKTMRDGMTMMEDMSANKPMGMKCDMMSHEQMMEKRMEMMQSMMKMMMDHLSVPASK
jgi:hypothetical protein